VEFVEKFATLHNDTEFRTWLYAENSGHAVSDYADTYLFDALSKVPRGVSTLETSSRIAGRARLGALFYSPGYLPVLATLYLELGRQGRTHWTASGSAAALWGLLTARGNSAASLEKQLGVLLNKHF